MAEILDIPWRRVRPLAGQPREYFDPAALAELATSIGAVGQLVPAKVAPVVDPLRRHDYELIDGQRRWHAVQAAGLETLRAEVVDEPDEERRYLQSVVANFSRQGHHPMEIAVACDRLRRTMPVERVAAVLGKSSAYVCQYLGLLRLHPDLKDLLHPTAPKGERLPLKAAVKLAALDHADQMAAWRKIRESGQSVLRATRRVCDEIPSAGAAQAESRAKPGNPKPRGADAYELVRVLTGHMRRTLHAMDAVRPGQFAEVLARSGSGRAGEVRAMVHDLIAGLGDLRDAEPGNVPIAVKSPARHAAKAGEVPR